MIVHLIVQEIENCIGLVEFDYNVYPHLVEVQSISDLETFFAKLTDPTRDEREQLMTGGWEIMHGGSPESRKTTNDGHIVVSHDFTVIGHYPLYLHGESIVPFRIKYDLVCASINRMIVKNPSYVFLNDDVRQAVISGDSVARPAIRSEVTWPANHRRHHECQIKFTLDVAMPHDYYFP